MNKYSIGINAGIIWRLLCCDNKKMDINELQKESGLSKEEVLTAIGWLARENKIQIEESDESNDLYMTCHYFF